MASRHSLTALGLPGRVIINVRPRGPATPRESMPKGVCWRLAIRIASAMPGASRSIMASVASGVTSRGARPVPPVVSHAAGLLHALLHALQAGGACPGDESLGGIARLRDRLDPARGELGLLLLPQRLQVCQAGELVLDRDALQDLAGLWCERLPLLLVDQDHEVGLEEVGQDAVLDVTVPVQVHQAYLGPGREVDRAALERGVELG